MPPSPKKVFIKTFGCIQNTADSEKIKTYYWEKGNEFTDSWKEADEVVINSCIVRESAENRVYGLIDEIRKFRPNTRIVVTGCLSGIKKKIDRANDVWTISKFENLKQLRGKKNIALIPISTGCNNYCSYCIVPLARGKETSISFEKIIKEVDEAIVKGFKEVILIGQNVNSYGSDLKDGGIVSMGKKRFKSMFPKLLEEVAKKKLDRISFVSSNPWDFSDELIEVIAKYPNIDRLVHLPFQSGDDEILQKMNRGYIKKEYLELVSKIKKKIADVKLSTDIIVGFPGEDEVAFQNTIDVCKKVGFEIAYINKYSPRKGTLSAKIYTNDIPMNEKKRRWKILNDLVNKKK
jgi:tRNA-2-methylthio-N6-dimethylallyladenosine synthase